MVKELVESTLENNLYGQFIYSLSPIARKSEQKNITFSTSLTINETVIQE